MVLSFFRTTRAQPLVGTVALTLLVPVAVERRTMLVVTHEMSFARDVSSKVVFLHKGLVEDEGPPGELFTASRSDRFRQFLAGSNCYCS